MPWLLAIWPSCEWQAWGVSCALLSSSQPGAFDFSLTNPIALVSRGAFGHGSRDLALCTLLPSHFESGGCDDRISNILHFRCCYCHARCSSLQLATSEFETSMATIVASFSVPALVAQSPLFCAWSLTPLGLDLSRTRQPGFRRPPFPAASQARATVRD